MACLATAFVRAIPAPPATATGVSPPSHARTAEKAQKAEARGARERVQREEYRKSCERTIAEGAAKLRALRYESDDYDPDRFFLLNLEKRRTVICQRRGE